MIPPNELRIGNYINRPDLGDGHLRTESVLAIYERVKTTGPIKTIFDFEDILPIHLTTGWLIRFGAIFPYEDNRAQIGSLCFYWNGKKLYLNESGWQEEIGEYPIATVHHLQNLVFYFTGTELTLKP